MKRKKLSGIFKYKRISARILDLVLIKKKTKTFRQ